MTSEVKFTPTHAYTVENGVITKEEERYAAISPSMTAHLEECVNAQRITKVRTKRDVTIAKAKNLIAKGTYMSCAVCGRIGGGRATEYAETEAWLATFEAAKAEQPPTPELTPEPAPQEVAPGVLKAAPLPPSRIAPDHSRPLVGEKKKNYMVRTSRRVWKANTWNGVQRMVAEALRSDPGGLAAYPREIWVDFPTGEKRWVRSESHPTHPDYKALVDEFWALVNPKAAPAKRQAAKKPEKTSETAASESPAGAGRQLSEKAVKSIGFLQEHAGQGFPVKDIEAGTGYGSKQLAGVLDNLAKKKLISRVDVNGYRGFVYHEIS